LIDLAMGHSGTRKRARSKNDDGKVIPAKRPKVVETWTVAEVASFLAENGFEECIPAFEEVDGKALLDVQKSDLKKTFDIKPALRRNELMAEIDELRDLPSAQAPVAHGRSTGQRRSPRHPVDEPLGVRVAGSRHRVAKPTQCQSGDCGQGRGRGCRILNELTLLLAIAFLAAAICSPLLYAEECGCGKDVSAFGSFPIGSFSWLSTGQNLGNHCQSLPASFLCWWSCFVHGKETEAAFYKSCTQTQR